LQTGNTNFTILNQMPVKEDVMENVMDRMQTIAQVWNSHDAGKVASLYTEDCVYDNEPGGALIKGREALKAYVDSLFGAIPDFKIELKSGFSSGTSAAAEWVWSGTPKGTLPSGLAATGKSFSVRLCTISEDQGDLMKQVTVYWDRVAFLTQLGLMPSAPG
jgi:steroid delta-isomerase-like uncharacterized protein